MPQVMDLFEAIDTQRAIRAFRPDPVPDYLITRLLQAAIKAPTGGLTQYWSFVVIRDKESRRKIGELYRAGDKFVIDPNWTGQQRRVYGTAQDMEENMGEIPAFILVCNKAYPGYIDTGSSIFPAVQNILLAARGLGLGAALTTRQTRFEAELKQMFNIPRDVHTVALLPIGFLGKGARYGPTRRKPLKEVAFNERWGDGWQP